jgi:5-methylcytosine-specific restriction endonuclease McrA
MKRKRNRKPPVKNLAHCMDCGIEIGYRVGKNHKCKSCLIKNPYVLECSDCGESIRHNVYHNTGKCYPCYIKDSVGSAHPGWKRGSARCLKCNVLIHSQARSKLCRKCWIKDNGINPNYLCKCGRRKAWVAKTCIECVDRKGSKNPAWKGGKSSYNWLWDINKMKALKRDNFTCQICFRYGIRLNVHHIVFLSNFMATQMEEAHALSNLITLCMGCHNSIHGQGKKIPFDKLIFPWQK